MKTLLNHVLTHRANALVKRLAPFIPPGSTLLDIGCGTGHNAQALGKYCLCKAIAQADVVDMSVIGPAPQIFNGRQLPFPDHSHDIGLLLFVLHYAEDAQALLLEARRVMRRRLLVIQSTYQDRLGLATLHGREWLQGRFAFRVANWCGLISQTGCSLHPRTFMTRNKLESLFSDAGWAIRQRQPAPWPLVGLSRDLYILEKS